MIASIQLLSIAQSVRQEIGEAPAPQVARFKSGRAGV
jgi:hypothetical protein